MSLRVSQQILNQGDVWTGEPDFGASAVLLQEVGPLPPHNILWNDPTLNGCSSPEFVAMLKRYTSETAVCTLA